MTQHMRRGMGVESSFGPYLWLDIRHLGEEHISTNLREVKDICGNFLGIDPARSLIPVRPTQHYSMGGVRTDADGAARGLEGLFAAGEAACWDLHGFNRLGGNSLAETIVAGRIVGEKVAEYLEGAEVSFPSGAVVSEIGRQRERIRRFTEKIGGENVFSLRREMEETLMSCVPIFRNAADLQKGVDRLRELFQRSGNVGLQTGGGDSSPELTAALRLQGELRLALCIACGALERTESRGSHYREDFPQRDDENWLKRTLAYWPESGDLPRLEYEDVTITELPPGDRGYGEATALGD